jgi:hypothetical protein
MNERIKELALECYNPYTEFDHEKFANLIIKECIELNRKELSFNSFERMLNKYQEHFGVEQ